MSRCRWQCPHSSVEQQGRWATPSHRLKALPQTLVDLHFPTPYCWLAFPGRELPCVFRPPRLPPTPRRRKQIGLLPTQLEPCVRTPSHHAPIRHGFLCRLRSSDVVVR